MAISQILFGSGTRNLIIIPGLGDGLKTVKVAAIPLAFQYRMFAKKFKVYVFSRRNNPPEGYSTRDVAADIYKVMEKLRIKKTSVIGVSMGGMIAQYLAIDYSKSIDKLVLAVTLARPNSIGVKVVGSWADMAKKEDYRNLMLDTAEKSYSDDYLRKNRWLLSLMVKFGKPKNFSRLNILVQACLVHDAYDELHKITCPTLIIGGMQDKIVTGEASYELAEQINGSELLIYEQLGHALYEEAKDFNEKVLEFLR